MCLKEIFLLHVAVKSPRQKKIRLELICLFVRQIIIACYRKEIYFERRD